MASETGGSPASKPRMTYADLEWVFDQTEAFIDVGIGDLADTIRELEVGEKHDAPLFAVRYLERDVSESRYGRAPKLVQVVLGTT